MTTVLIDRVGRSYSSCLFLCVLGSSLSTFTVSRKRKESRRSLARTRLSTHQLGCTAALARPPNQPERPVREIEKQNDMIECPHRWVLQLSLEKECEGLLPDCSVGMKESRQQRQFKLNALAARTATYNLCYMYDESDDRVTRHTASDRQQNIRWWSLRQVSTWHDRS